MNPIASVKIREEFSHKATHGPGVESLRIAGVFSMVTRRRGRIAQAVISKNLVVNAGLAGLASRIGGAGSEAAFTYIALGTSGTSPAAGNTTLGAEITTSGLGRVNASASRQTTNVTNDTAQLQNTFSVSGSQTVAEAGIFNAGSSGTMLCRSAFTGQPLLNGDSYQVTYKVICT